MWEIASLKKDNKILRSKSEKKDMDIMELKHPMRNRSKNPTISQSSISRDSWFQESIVHLEEIPQKDMHSIEKRGSDGEDDGLD